MRVIEQDIKNKTFKRAYLLFGEEAYLKNRYKNLLISAVSGADNTESGGDTMNTSRYEGKDIREKAVIDMAETLPFLSEYRLIVMEDTGLFKSGGEDLARYMSEVPETTVFIFAESQVDKRGRMYKAVKKYGYTCEFTRQTDGFLSRWAAGQIAVSGKNISARDAGYFVAKVGNDMEALSCELEKLISYAWDKDTITARDIDAICSTQLSVRIFDLVDAISAKNPKKTLDAYYELIEEREPPMRILTMIERQFHLLIQAKELSLLGMSQKQIEKTMGVHPFVAEKSIRQSRNFALDDLKAGLNDSVKTEEEIKTGLIDENIGVEMLMLKYSRGPALR